VGFTYQEVTKNLRRLEFDFYRSAQGNHEIWLNLATNQKKLFLIIEKSKKERSKIS